MRRIGPYVALAALASIVAVTAHELATGPTVGAGSGSAAGPGSGGVPAGAPGGNGPGTADPEPAADGGAGPEVRLERRRYAVAGTTARGLRRSLRANGRRMEGEVAFAWTDWSVDVGYEFRRSGDTCRVIRPDVEVSVAVTLPEWRHRNDVSPDLEERWRRDLAIMEEHEEGHVRLARRAGRRVYGALDSLGPSPCASLRDRADVAAGAVLEDVKRAQEAYDERTDHGRDQHAGVVLDRR